MATRTIVGASGIPVAVSEAVASGLVGAGYAQYAGEAPAPAGNAPEQERPNKENSTTVEVEDETGEDEAGGFDPSTAGVHEVLSYLANADEAERARVFAAEAEGKARKTILDQDI